MAIPCLRLVSYELKGIHRLKNPFCCAVGANASQNVAFVGTIATFSEVSVQ